MDETTLTKGRIRKLNALRRLVDDKLGEEAFSKWVELQAAATVPKADPVAEKIEEALAGFVDDRSGWATTATRSDARAARACPGSWR